jgi:hypothetical protein
MWILFLFWFHPHKRNKIYGFHIIQLLSCVLFFIQFIFLSILVSPWMQVFVTLFTWPYMREMDHMHSFFQCSHIVSHIVFDCSIKIGWSIKCTFFFNRSKNVVLKSISPNLDQTVMNIWLHNCRHIWLRTILIRIQGVEEATILGPGKLGVQNNFFKSILYMPKNKINK